MPMAHVYPAFILIACLMLLGAILARRSRFYGQLTAPQSAGRFECLDGLRGFLAIAVMIHHGMSVYMRVTTGQWTVADHPTYKLFGVTSVALFFMITGFLFWGKVLAKQGRIDVRSHVRGRLMRLAPLYLFVATIATVITLISLWPLHASFGRLSALLFTIYAMGIPAWGKMYGFDPGYIVAGVTWTLRYEWLFYGVLPLLVFFRKPQWVVMATTGYVVYFIATTHGWMHKPLGPSVNLIGGMLVAQLHHGGVLAKFNWRSRRMSVIGMLLLAAMPYALTNLPILLLPLTLAVFFLVISGNTFFGVLTARGPKTIGTMSYSIYLQHGIVLYLGGPLLRLAALNHSAGLYWLALGGVGATSVAISAVTYRWIEHPFIELEKARRKTAVPATILPPVNVWPTKPALAIRLAA